MSLDASRRSCCGSPRWVAHRIPPGMPRHSKKRPSGRRSKRPAPGKSEHCHRSVMSWLCREVASTGFVGSCPRGPRGPEYTITILLPTVTVPPPSPILATGPLTEVVCEDGARPSCHLCAPSKRTCFATESPSSIRFRHHAQDGTTFAFFNRKDGGNPHQARIRVPCMPYSVRRLSSTENHRWQPDGLCTAMPAWA